MYRNRRFSSLVVALFAIILTTSVLSILPMGASAYTIRSNIYIDGNSDFTTANGVTGGSGTAVNPWIIDGWYINDTIGAITIRHTDDYFIIRGVSIIGGIWGVFFDNIAHGSIENSIIVSGLIGVCVDHSSDFTISGNTITSLDLTIDIEYSTNAQISSNYLNTGINIWGDSISHYNSHIITDDNTVNSRPLYYYKNTSDLSIESIVIGQLILAGCQDCKISNLNISNGVVGILNAYCENSIITDCLVSDNWIGIELDYSNHCTISGNNASLNRDGIYFFSTNNSIISCNDLYDNIGSGINLDSCSVDTIVGNELLKNALGINLTMSQDILVHHNNFISNTDQAVDDGGNGNSWDDGFASGGNHWSDYSGSDLDNDGIGDTPYVIDSNSKDNYPLMAPCSDAPPTARITANRLIGNLTTLFSLDPRTSSDFEDPIGVMEVRWDWENDGLWDVGWSSVAVITHQYSTEGNHTIRIEVRDSRGLSDTATIQLLVDGTPPILSILTPAGFIAHDSNVNISWSCSDESSGIDCIRYSLDGYSFGLCNDSCVILSGLSDGTHNLQIRAFDKAGNLVTENLTFVVDTNVFSPNGPFGPLLLIAIIAGVVAVIAVALVALVRRKKKGEKTEIANPQVMPQEGISTPPLQPQTPSQQPPLSQPPTMQPPVTPPPPL